VIGSRIDEIHDRALVLTEDCRMWISNEVADRCGVPVISTRQPVLIIQALLDYGPLAFRGDYKTVQVDLKAVSNGVVVDARCEPAGTHQSVTVEAAFVGKCSKLIWRVAREATAAAADVNAELVRAWR